jgi:endonuclease/exonuclease/phosphatase (EEP) superfamily protein YafD
MSEPPEPPGGDPAASRRVPPPLRRRDRLGALARSIVNLSAVLYLLALLAVVAALRLIGERWWVTTIALYLPRIGFALPLPLLVVALLFGRSYRLLATQVAAAVVLLFPLMGLHLGGERRATAGALRFRLFALNIGLAKNGTGEVLDLIHGANPDVVVLEEVDDDNVETLRLGLPGYAFRHLDQFVIASRFPVDEEAVPRRIWIDGRARSSQYARCRLITPAGPLRLFAAHPISPHDAFDQLRGHGLRHELLSGRIFQAASARAMEPNTRERLEQVRALAADAASSSDPVLIAGDTNLPGLSWALSHWLGGFSDGFAEVGRGFGYSYPAQRMVWMRIDRILAGARFRFLDAATISPRVSDHLAVAADLELIPARP